MAINLDEVDFSQFDKSNMITQIKSFTADFKKAWEETGSIQLPDDFNKVKNIVLLGMGGSGAANEAIKELAFTQSCPIDTVHDYALPGYVNEETLVVASSYSGNTEETIDGFKEAQQKGAKLFVVSTGGELLRLAQEHNVPFFSFDYPSQPRMAAPYLLTPLLRIFSLLGLYALPQDFNELCQGIYQTITTFYPEVPVDDNPAKQLALKLYKRFPIFYASASSRGLAMWFKNQLNENAKKAAAFDYFPELNHNTIEGYVFPDCDLFVVVLESKFNHDRVSLRQEITALILEKAGVGFGQISFDTGNELAEHLVVMSFADAVSFYLSILNQTDPTSIPNINFLKSKL